MSDKFEAIQDYVADRVVNYSAFASKYMKKSTSKFYLEDMLSVTPILLEKGYLGKDSIQDFMGDVAEAFRDRPLKCNSIRATINGDMACELEARKLAISHILDLAYSYRRFMGIVPCGKEEFALRRYATGVITSHLKSFLSK